MLDIWDRVGIRSPGFHWWEPRPDNSQCFGFLRLSQSRGAPCWNIACCGIDELLHSCWLLAPAKNCLPRLPSDGDQGAPKTGFRGTRWFVPRQALWVCLDLLLRLVESWQSDNAHSVWSTKPCKYKWGLVTTSWPEGLQKRHSGEIWCRLHAPLCPPRLLFPERDSGWNGVLSHVEFF